MVSYVGTMKIKKVGTASRIYRLGFSGLGFRVLGSASGLTCRLHVASAVVRATVK